MNLVKKLQSLCLKHRLTLGLAESCTGGALAARITHHAGSSQYFAGSIVSYQNAIKTKILGVSEGLLQNKGPVNPETAKEMLIGVLEVMDTDLALAVTGLASPLGSTPEIPVGTVYIAVGGKNIPMEIRHLHLEGSRGLIIEKAVDMALTELIKMIERKDLALSRP